MFENYVGISHHLKEKDLALSDKEKGLRLLNLFSEFHFVVILDVISKFNSIPLPKRARTFSFLCTTNRAFAYYLKVAHRLFRSFSCARFLFLYPTLRMPKINFFERSDAFFKFRKTRRLI